uniref:Putative ovule protein n=1 Tax=Solanum chacoense TaxID=4108 RepID=A0A0V0ICI0_SOLCH
MCTHGFSTNWYCFLYFLQPYDQLHIACLLFHCSYILGVIRHESSDVFPVLLLRKMFTISLILVGQFNTLSFAGA